MTQKISAQAYENKKNYIKKYRKENTKELMLRFNIYTDADIIAKLDSLKGTKTEYIRKLIRADIENSK